MQLGDEGRYMGMLNASTWPVAGAARLRAVLWLRRKATRRAVVLKCGGRVVVVEADAGSWEVMQRLRGCVS